MSLEMQIGLIIGMSHTNGIVHTSVTVKLLFREWYEKALLS